VSGQRVSAVVAPIAYVTASLAVNQQQKQKQATSQSEQPANCSLPNPIRIPPLDLSYQKFLAAALAEFFWSSVKQPKH